MKLIRGLVVMKLKDGLYEQVINTIIADNVDKLSHEKLITKEKIDEAESSMVLSRYLAGVIKKGLSYIDNDERKIGIQVAICNRIINTLLRETGEESLSECMHGGSTTDERNSAQEKLLRREINFIFVVDLYNEGVDIPEVNTVLFLRPTESLTVFLQQLGRGLRLLKARTTLLCSIL